MHLLTRLPPCHTIWNMSWLSVSRGEVHLRGVVKTYDRGRISTGHMTIFMALPHALATGSDQPYSARFGPRLNIWKRHPQKKAAPAQHEPVGTLLCAVVPRHAEQTGCMARASNVWHSAQIPPPEADRFVQICIRQRYPPSTQKNTVSQNARSCI